MSKKFNMSSSLYRNIFNYSGKVFGPEYESHTIYNINY